jgi:hypothetical protein
MPASTPPVVNAASVLVGSSEPLAESKIPPANKDGFLMSIHAANGSTFHFGVKW